MENFLPELLGAMASNVDDLLRNPPQSSSHGASFTSSNQDNTFQNLLPGFLEAMASNVDDLGRNQPPSNLENTLQNLLPGLVGAMGLNVDGHARNPAPSSSHGSSFTSGNQENPFQNILPGLVGAAMGLNVDELGNRPPTSSSQGSSFSSLNLESAFQNFLPGLVGAMAQGMDAPQANVEDTFRNTTTSNETTSMPNTTSTSNVDDNASSEGKGPIPSCPVCWEAMKPPRRIFQCQNGHLICEVCRSQPQTRGCPTCRQPIMGRATAMEQLLADLQSRASQSKNNDSVSEAPTE